MAGRHYLSRDRGHPCDDRAGNIRAWGRASRAAQCLPPLITDPAPAPRAGRHDGPVEAVAVAVRADGRVVTGGGDDPCPGIFANGLVTRDRRIAELQDEIKRLRQLLDESQRDSKRQTHPFRREHSNESKYDAERDQPHPLTDN